VGLDLPVNAMITTATMATISTLLPSSPGYVGTFHFFAAQSLIPYQVPLVTALSFAFICHTILWTSVTSFGGIAYFVTIKAMSNSRNKRNL